MFGRWFSTTFAAMAEPNFRILWVGSLFATLAFMMMFVTQSVVAFELAGTNSAVGIVSLGVGVTMLILGPFGGVTADRVSKRKLIILGQGSVVVLFAVIGVLLVSDVLTLLMLILLTAALGLGFAFMGPARHAYVADLVEPRALPNAVALSQLGHGGGQILAPVLAGVLLSTAAIGSGGTYLLMAVLVFIGVASIGLLPSTPGRPASERGSVLHDLRAGVNHVRSQPTLRLILLLFVAVMVLGSLFRVVLPALLERHLDRDPTDIGLMFSINAVAGFTVSLGLAGLVGTRWVWPALFVLTAMLGVGYFALAAAPSFGYALLSMVLIGPGFSSFILLSQTVIMANTAPAFYARVMSLTMLAFGLQSIVALPFGVLADKMGEREVIVLLGIATLGVAVLGLLGYAGMRRRLSIEVAIDLMEVAVREVPITAKQKPGLGGPSV